MPKNLAPYQSWVTEQEFVKKELGYSEKDALPYNVRNDGEIYESVRPFVVF